MYNNDFFQNTNESNISGNNNYVSNDMDVNVNMNSNVPSSSMPSSGPVQEKEVNKCINIVYTIG